MLARCDALQRASQLIHLHGHGMLVSYEAAHSRPTCPPTHPLRTPRRLSAPGVDGLCQHQVSANATPGRARLRGRGRGCQGAPRGVLAVLRFSLLMVAA